MVSSLDELPFDNRFTNALSADPDLSNRRRQITGAHFSRTAPTAVAGPTLIAASTEVAELLSLSAEVVASQDFADVFSGNRLPTGADPFAMNYGGHQFGNWAGQLGDGRAIAIGEVLDNQGRHQTLQLKGAGPTPYSRTADGRAVLRSSVREFLCSEAMFHLGVPTTRALSLVATGDRVVRDMLYDGNPQAEPGAVVCRVAPSFVRFGSFQLPASRGELTVLRDLVEFTIRADFAHLAPGLDDESTWEQTVATWFGEVCERTVELVVHWMRVGFVHGVLNTDNMSILGLTIDFGPYGWLEDFDPGWTPNTTDASGRRYRYGAQPQVVYWNLVQLANALSAIVTTTELLQEQINMFPARYSELYRAMMLQRLGLTANSTGEIGEISDDDLIQSLLNLLPQAEIDQVIFFRKLAEVVGYGGQDLLSPLMDIWYNAEDATDATGPTGVALRQWLEQWSQRITAEGRAVETVRAQMNSVNPKFVLRNYLAQEAIDLATGGDYSLIATLLDVLRRPYDDQLNQPSHERFALKRPEWARNRVGCSMLSCSS
jgi:serine/tyrosine/threonine adenylyltransferase